MSSHLDWRRVELWRRAYGRALQSVSRALAAVIPMLDMSSHPSEPIRYVEQFKTDLC
jgi:hypothetical protein